MKKIKNVFDTCNYPKEHLLYSEVNKKVLGKFKDECDGKNIEEFVGLRAKLYAYKVGDVEEKKCKGVDKNVVKQTVNIEDYKKVLFEGSIAYRKMVRFQSNYHQIYTKEANKVALTANDDKRVIGEDGISTKAYGHYKLG